MSSASRPLPLQCFSQPWNHFLQSKTMFKGEVMALVFLLRRTQVQHDVAAEIRLDQTTINTAESRHLLADEEDLLALSQALGDNIADDLASFLVFFNAYVLSE